MATRTSTTSVSSLVINKVDTKTTFANMLTNNQVNENELYFIPSEIGGNSEIFGIEFNTSSTATNNEITCNKTFSEILNAINNGYPIYAVVAKDHEPRYNLSYIYDGEEARIVFETSVLPLANNEHGYETISYSNTNVISTTVVPIQIQQSNATLTIGSYIYDGTTAVTIPVYNGSYYVGTISEESH